MDLTYKETHRQIETDQGILHYHEAGTGEPLLLLHGSGIGVSGWRNYRRNLSAFAQHFRCYILEFPGFGISDPVDGHPVLTAGSAALRFMDALEIETAAVIGNSMGGVVGINLAIRSPQRISRLITIGGVGPNIFSPNPSEGTRLLQEFADSPSKDKLVRWLMCMVHDPSIVTEELIEERWEAATGPASQVALAAMYGSKAFELQRQMLANSDRPPYWSMMHKVTCPTLLTWGINDRQSPVDMLLAPMRLIPNAEVHTFPNCGHWVMIEAKQAFERLSLEFLQR
ncbi:Pimeloyl-ACP methyl ester carboxylesterase [Nocardia amikacinitolerans]|uniref:Pimeloyl-ACP methyl ester carboxylesterase n=1 Tax=Nocardia amikacinitolerans TaxID=756689 RepID=A0A285M0M2_9NOCA|nr:alpha/beta fold hydrolase [Nocardia amikacinitolerans]MCP2279549.1 Pimeloyl-ACP methyl ester carboxylesterase [Nocardia amikacinitolerans]MCP2298574.1 Pimeloyl-ACP methyl ester carboxylesterase [Nocardia amikacinitolerans]SNY89466.1 Pimeloyl-ACP methyl ester carboxylesterase [Nocardia amikacinitolerans]